MQQTFPRNAKDFLYLTYKHRRGRRAPSSSPFCCTFNSLNGPTLLSRLVLRRKLSIYNFLLFKRTGSVATTPLLFHRQQMGMQREMMIYPHRRRRRRAARRTGTVSQLRPQLQSVNYRFNSSTRIELKPDFIAVVAGHGIHIVLPQHFIMTCNCTLFPFHFPLARHHHHKYPDKELTTSRPNS